MPLFFVDEDYNGSSGNVNANAGNWVSATIDFLHIVNFEVEELSKETIYRSIGGSHWFERTDGSKWSDLGFVGGKTINLDAEIMFIGWVLVPMGSFVIDYIDDNKMFLTAEVPLLSDGATFPIVNDDGEQVRFMYIRQIDAPESVEFDFNLTRPDAPSLNSVIDGNINRFKLDSINTMSIGSTLDMEQIGLKSGGYIIRPKIKYVGIEDGYRRYSITFLFMQWGFLQSGYEEPEYLEGVNTLGAIANVRMFSELGNPNSILEDKTSNNDGNIGGFNENYNTGINPYELTSITLTSGISTIGAINYCGDTHFIATIEGDDFDTLNSRFTIGLSWRTIDEEVYYNKVYNFGQNTATLAPVNQFSHSLTPDATMYNGNLHQENGMQWSFQNLKFTISGSTLTVEGDILSTGTNSEALDSLGEGEKRLTLWVSPDRGDVPNSLKKKTSIILHDKDGICAPPAPTSFPVTGVRYEDHGEIDVTSSTTRLTTEDDTLYTISFDLVKELVYDRLSHKVSMRNSVTGEEFTLEEMSVDFSSFPYIDGKHEVYSEQPRPFNLPPSSNKKTFNLNRNPVGDTLFLYSFKMDYGFLNRWEYWLSQLGASTDFYDPSQPNDGLNKDWQRMDSFADWSVRMTTTVYRGINVQNYINEFDIRPYEDEDVVTVLSYVNLEDMSEPDTLVSETLMQVTATLTWVEAYNPIGAWSQVTIENFESSNRWIISSHLPHEGETENPLKPIDGEEGLSMILAGNVATLKYIIDTNIVDADNVSLTHRIHSNRQGVGIGKLKEDGVLKLSEDSTVKQKD